MGKIDQLDLIIAVIILSCVTMLSVSCVRLDENKGVKDADKPVVRYYDSEFKVACYQHQLSNQIFCVKVGE